MAYNFRNLSVLIAEDSRPMMDLVVSIMNTFGVEDIIMAENGKEAFKKFCAHKPDLVIADWMMRPGDGIELVQAIRTHPDSPNTYVPYILMTGFSEKHRVIQARDTGITEFMVKPFSVRDLYKRIETIIERPRQFIRSDNFFGPDRRRKKDEWFNGELKRETDITPEDYMLISAKQER